MKLSFGRFRHLDVELSDGDVIISYERCVAADRVLQLRESELRGLVRKGARRLGQLAIDDIGPRAFRVLQAAQDAKLMDRLSRLDGHIQRLATGPFTPRMVSSLLDITSRERLRWSKDGRLKISGALTFHPGHTVTIPSYDADEIVALATNPAVIAQWRLQDKSADIK